MNTCLSYQDLWCISSPGFTHMTYAETGCGLPRCNSYISSGNHLNPYHSRSSYKTSKSYDTHFYSSTWRCFSQFILASPSCCASNCGPSCSVSSQSTALAGLECHEEGRHVGETLQGSPLFLLSQAGEIWWWPKTTVKQPTNFFWMNVWQFRCLRCLIALVSQSFKGSLRSENALETSGMTKWLPILEAICVYRVWVYLAFPRSMQLDIWTHRLFCFVCFAVSFIHASKGLALQRKKGKKQT